VIRTFIYTPEFDKLWKSSGLSESEIILLEQELLTNPSKGKVITGACSLRKLRFKLPGKGKRGGIRVLYVDFQKFSEIHFISLIKKNEKENISADDKKLICKLINQIEANLESKYIK
jgi:hypothetical protein